MKREKQKVKNGGKKFKIKNYLRDFLIFVDEKLIKKIGVLLVISILLVALSISPMVNSALASECEGACRDGASLYSEYISRLKILLFTLVGGVVPYVCMSVVGLIGYLLSETASLAFAIKGYGYLGGIGLGIVPLLLNILTISILTALGMYICKTVTVGYKISSLKNMNFTNFRIRLFEVLQKEEKVKRLNQEKDKKIGKLEKTREKINYLQILNTSIVVCIIQFISVVIQQILL